MRAKDWFHGVIGAAEEAVARVGANSIPGQYLIRQTPFNDHYIISFVDVDFTVKHYKVQGTSSGDKRARDGRGFTEKFNF